MIEIEPDWRITADRYQWMLQQKKIRQRENKTTGKIEPVEEWVAQSWHPSAKAAVLAYGERRQRAIPDGPLQDTINELKAVRQAVQALSQRIAELHDA